MMNSTEGIAMYEEMMVEMPPHIDSLDWVEYIDTYMWFYYGHEFYELFYPEIYQTAVDSLNPGMCYNGTFQESSLSDDHVKGFKLYAGLAPNDEYCVFDHSKLMNLPLPENSTPDDPLFPFNLNPFDNENTTQFPGYKSFSSVELFLEGSGPDELTGLINSNPPSGNRSIRLNRGDFGFSGFGMSVTMERSFIVEEENSLFTIGFSFIGSHREVDTFDFVFLLDNYRPSFTIVLLDENDLVINQRCFSMHHNESDFEFVFQGGQFGSFIFRDWALIKEDLSNHIDEKVTLRIVSSHAPFNTKRDMGYGYLSDICLDCGGYPMWEVDLGNTSVECPFYYPISICNSISFNDSIFTIEDFYLQIVNNGIIYQTITNGSYDPLSGDICFELTKDIIKNLPKKGYDIFTFAKFRNNITDSVFIIKSKSYTPNTLEDLNNDLIVTCCPEVILDTLDLCEPELIDLCGEIDLDSCQIEILNLNLEIFGIDSVSTKVDLTLDSLNSFCFHISDSLISEWEEYCVRIIVELMYYDSTKGDTITIIQEFENNNGDCLLDEECCPDEEPVQFTLNRILCLTGSNYSHATFDIEGSMHLGNLPDGYSYCGEKPVFNGGHIDYTKYHVTSHFIQFSGILHITDTSQLIYNSSTNRYCLTGTLKVCDEFEQECEIDIIICFSTSQPDMCFEMEGLMCMNFIVNTSPYFPQSGNPPIVFGDDVWLTLVLGVPFIDKYIGEGDTCSIDTYWFEVYGVSSTSIPSHDLLHQSVLQKQGNETSGIFQEQLYIPVSDWNSYDYIEVKFWNNCGDTCTAQQIPVVPVPGDGDRAIMEIVEEEVEVTAFPVPFSDEVIINYQLTMEKTEFRVYDSIGRLIDEGLFSNREGEYLLNTRQWSSGWYILEINDPELKDRTLILIKE